VFNADTKSLAADGSNTWLSANENKNLSEVMARINRLAPTGGTSLYKAFESIRGLAPRPDNIILLTDGLPTLGKSGNSGGRVSGKKRLRYFKQAVRVLPEGVPVNAILFPIEGDPLAASEFWKLAVNSGGSFMSPSRDWP